MLELLSKGGTSKIIAESLGYTDGTARVYLHNMYKHLGVRNKTGAVAWYLERMAKRDRLAEGGWTEGPTSATSFGDFAVKTDLNACLGVMSIFIGPHSKQWEVAQQLNNADQAIEPEQQERIRVRSRRLWHAHLRGEFAEAKREFDAGHLSKIFVESITDAFMVAMMLQLGGFTGSAKKATNLISSRQGAGIGTSRDERAVLAAIAGVFLGQLQLASVELENIGLLALPAVVIGGLQSIPGAVLGGVLVGLIEQLASGYVSPKARDIFIYGLLRLVLLIRPWGLFGQRELGRV